jgi:hypothetical protein
LNFVTNHFEADSVLGSSDVRTPGIALNRADGVNGDPDAPAGYSPIGTARVNGRRIAIYAFQNGTIPDDLADQGRGSAEVFDRAGNLKRRFIFSEHRNSPPQITEFIYAPER